MAGEIIRKGDPTSHGGVVLEGSMSDICMGQPIAYMGHKVQCPQCKGIFPIVEGVLTTTFYGKGIAVAGMKTACGATLIATQFTDIVEWCASAASGVRQNGLEAMGGILAPTQEGGKALVADESKAAEGEEIFDEQYALLDNDGQTLSGIPYTVRLPSGELKQGISDEDGLTDRYATNGEQPLEVFLGHI